jgi:hypothetical protein
MQGPPRIRPAARPVPPAAPAAPADAARQDRFLRQLVPSPWDEVEEAEVSEASWFDAPLDPLDEGQGDGSSSQGDDERNDGEEAAQPPPPPPAEAGDTPFQAFPPWPWMQAAGRDGSEGHPGEEGSQVMRTTATSSIGDAPSWLGDIVQQVSQLSEGGDARFQHWSITVPLDPQALPDCELHLTLSPGTMALRFCTGSAQSAALVSRHRDRLRAQLEALPSSPPAIDIDLE